MRWPGYLSIAEDIKFTDMPGGTIASWAALPALSWVQIVLVVALLDNSVLAQDPAKAPGDVQYLDDADIADLQLSPEQGSRLKSVAAQAAAQP